MIQDNLQNIEVLPLEKLALKRESFSCGVGELERYFHQLASQDVKRGLAKCFVLIDKEKMKIIGYYTLSALSVSVADIPKDRLKKGIPYPNIPAALIGRLAIDDDFQQQGYGQFLVIDAIHNIKNAAVAVAIILVEAKDDNAVAFYKKLGFIEFEEVNSERRKLFYPVNKIIK